MVARSGLFVDPVPGTPPVGTSMADARRALAALIGTSVKPLSGGVITTSGSSLFIGMSQSVWTVPDPADGASAFLVPADFWTQALAAGPTTGSRIDMLCIKQNNYANGDVDSRANYLLVQGTPGTPGVIPPTPTGYTPIVWVTIPTNAATSSQFSFTYAYRRATSGPPQVNAATYALLTAFAGEFTGQLGTVTSDTAALNGLYIYTGATNGWVQVAAMASAWTPFAGTIASPAYPSGLQSPGFGYVPSYKLLGDSVELAGVVQKSGGAAFASGDAVLTVPYPPTAVVYCMANGSGAAFASLQIAPGTGALTVHSVKGTAPTWLSLDSWTYRRV